MQEELDQLEAKNAKNRWNSQNAQAMALNHTEDSFAKKAARYKAQKNESIFGDEDCVKPEAPIRSAP